MNINYLPRKTLKELCITLCERSHSTKAHIWREFDIFTISCQEPLSQWCSLVLLAQMLALGAITVLERNGLLCLLVYSMFAYLNRNGTGGYKCDHRGDGRPGNKRPKPTRTCQLKGTVNNEARKREGLVGCLLYLRRCEISKQAVFQNHLFKVALFSL